MRDFIEDKHAVGDAAVLGKPAPAALEDRAPAGPGERRQHGIGHPPGIRVNDAAEAQHGSAPSCASSPRRSFPDGVRGSDGTSK